MNVVTAYILRYFENICRISGTIFKQIQYFSKMEGSRRKEEKYGSPSTSSAEFRQDQSFSDADLRRKQIAEKIGVSDVVVLGMSINGVTYQGVLLPQKECKFKKT